MQLGTQPAAAVSEVPELLLPKAPAKAHWKRRSEAHSRSEDRNRPANAHATTAELLEVVELKLHARGRTAGGVQSFAFEQRQARHCMQLHISIKKLVAV
jgi:hypothetical protein